jgi:hypothetical protein
MSPRSSPLVALAIVACLAFALPALKGASAGDEASAAQKEAKSLLDAGQGAAALEKAKTGLEFEPESFELLDLASRCAKAAGSSDEALWYAELALRQAGTPLTPPTKERQKTVDEINARIAELDTLQMKGEKVRGEYASALFALGADCAKRKIYVVAVGLLTRLRGTSVSDKAEVELAKIYDNKKAVEELLESGVDVPVKPVKKRKPQQVAKEDSKHASWATAYEVKGDQYTIKTDMGIELAESFSRAMEQINHFYRKVFQVKEQGGKTARITIKVYRSRAEFDANEKENEKPFAPEVKGFFSVSKSQVCTYDPREEQRSLAFLWSTLFHESSHQFTAIALTGGNEPTWLNEGTASYFEGARYLPNGSVQFNLVAEERLAELKVHLAEGRPTLKDVVTYAERGSYPGEYYPFGWGLVYFLLNYENDKSQRIYALPYRDFMATYKEGKKHDVLGRFVEYFVTKVKQPGIAKFEDFDKRWKEWIQNLDRLYFGPPEIADELIQRARKQHADKQDETAAETYAWALRKRPDDPVSFQELADIQVALKKTDAALFNYRRAIETVRALPDPTQKLPSSGDLAGSAIADACAQRLVKLDKPLSEGLGAADARFEQGTVEAAKAYAEAKLPLVALELLDDARVLFGPAHDLVDARLEIAKATGADTRRWRRIPVNAELDSWVPGEGWKGDGGTLSCTTPGLSLCTIAQELPEEFRFEVRLSAETVDTKGTYFGLVFGANETGLQLMLADAHGEVKAGEIAEGQKMRKVLGKLKPEGLKDFVLGLDVTGDGVEFFIDGKSAGKLEYTADELAGSIGVFAQNGTAKFRDVRLRW